MNKIRNFVKIFTLFMANESMINNILVLINEGKCRKYDIEDEAVKLYGEDLKSVLKRFRRTPDYLKILNDKMSELKAYLNDVGLQTLYYYNNKLKEKITNMLLTEDDVTQIPAGTGAMRYMRSNFGHFPFDSHFNPHHIQKSIAELRQPKREGEVEEKEKTNPVESLDKYSLLTSSLTLQERNMFRDMGFEFAGQIIHSIIKSMGNEDFSQRSTRLPNGEYENQHQTTTAKHYHDIMSTNQMQSTAAADIVPTDETFKFKYRAPRMPRMRS